MSKKRTSNKKKDTRFKGSMRIIMLVLLMICGTLAYRSWRIHQEAQAYAAQEERLQEQIREEQERQAEIEQRAEYLNSDKYIEDLARDKLGLIYENEIIFKKEGR